MNKQVYTFETQVPIPNNPLPVVLSLSKYADSLLLFLNQTGAVGSIIEGVAVESTAELAEQEEYDSAAVGQSGFVYNIRVLLGSTEIEFYELLLRRVMGVVWEEMRTGFTGRVLLNISLPVLNSAFKAEDYYGALVEASREALKSVM